MTNEHAIDILNAVKFILEDYTEEMEEAFSMAINALTAQPEKTQLSGEEATFDCISRQAAIDAVEFGITYAKAINKSTGEVKELFNEGNKALNEAVERLKELPSAQPELIEREAYIRGFEQGKTQGRLDTLSAQPVAKDINVSINDCISRQMAINALKEHRNLFCDNTPDTFSVLPYGDKCRVDELDMAIATLINLPSAPQRTGRWVKIKESIKLSEYRCSECGRTVCDDRGYAPCVDYPYCHCGARMEGES